MLGRGGGINIPPALQVAEVAKALLLDRQTKPQFIGRLNGGYHSGSSTRPSRIAVCKAGDTRHR